MGRPAVQALAILALDRFLAADVAFRCLVDAHGLKFAANLVAVIVAFLVVLLAAAGFLFRLLRRRESVARVLDLHGLRVSPPFLACQKVAVDDFEHAIDGWIPHRLSDGRLGGTPAVVHIEQMLAGLLQIVVRRQHLLRQLRQR